ncbi:hypothetical protein E3U55_16595 [Filobacillus milosensis]|uniref:VWA domain-containing protein n=1 Tax=Filobacillus milosensis TaxID=94137 RepID=A0A4Y8IBG1_9BACI|nr:hypothetical protein [Filobacillus milosensis]TFB13170.1 hypothetical protein E3U55_16595 [Filobacillus milosensis]
MYDDGSLPIFYHGRHPQLIRAKNKVKNKSVNSPRTPITQETLTALFNSVQPRQKSVIIKKLNLNKTLTNHIGHQKNLADSLVYNHIEQPEYNHEINVLLIDASFSMSKSLSKALKIAENISSDIILYHDINLFHFSYKRESVECLGGTNYYLPLRRLSDLNKKFKVIHLTDGDTTINDKFKSTQLINQKNELTYEEIKV